MTYAKKLQQTTLLYIRKCTNEQAFQGGKPSRQFWLTRGFFYKQILLTSYLTTWNQKMVTKK